MKLSIKQLLIGALVIGLLAFVLHVFLTTGKKIASPAAQMEEKKPTSSPQEKAELKALPDQKGADAAKVVVIVSSLQGTLSGKRPLNAALFKSLDQSSAGLSETLKSYNLDSVKEIRSIKNQTDVLMLAMVINQALKKISDTSSSLQNLGSLTPSSNSFTATNSFLDLQRIQKDSILRKMAEAMQAYAKNIDAVQKNVLDKESLANLQQSLALGVEQMDILEGKSGTFNAQTKDVLENLRQTPWSGKAAIISKDVLIFQEQFNLLKKILADSEALKTASENPDPSSIVKTKLALDPKAPGDQSVKTQNSAGVDYQKIANVLTLVSNELATPKSYSNQVFPNMNKWKAQLDEALESTSQEVEQPLVASPMPLKNQEDLLLLARRIQTSLTTLSNLDKPIANAVAQASTAAIMTAPNALLDIKRIPVESPLRTLAISFDEFQKANLAWQKNILDLSASAGVIQALSQTLEQISALEDTVSGQPPAVIEVLGKIRQITWQVRAEESKTSLASLKDQFEFLRLQLKNTEKIADAARIEKNSTSYAGLLSSPLFSWMPILLEAISLLLVTVALFKSSTAVVEMENAIQPVSVSIQDDLEKRTPYLQMPREVKQSELVPELNEKIQVLEKKFIQSYKSSEKIMSYTQELMSKVNDLRTVNTASPSTSLYVHLDVREPLEEIDAAIISLKQIGIRLFMSILENHSTRQLADETEEMNTLVEKTEIAFVAIKALVDQINEKALPKRQTSDQAGMDLIDLDVSLVLKEVKLWQNDLTELNQTIMTLNELVGKYV